MDEGMFGFMLFTHHMADKLTPGEFLRDDEKLMKNALRCAKILTPPSVSNTGAKSPTRTQILIDKGNAAFKASPHSLETIKIYTEALAYAPVDSHPELMAKCYGNRSAVLCNCKYYDFSLKDIDKALKIGYPDHLKAKLYIRRVKNLLALHNGKSNERIIEATKDARYWIDKISDAEIRKKTQGSLNGLKNLHLKSHKKFDPTSYVSAIRDDNRQILRASSAIALKYSEEFGRHVVATRDIKPGEALTIQKVYASTLLSDNRYTRCWNCSRATWSSVPCNNCSNVIFCDETCRDSAWNDYHDIECRVISAMPPIFLRTECVLAIRVTIKAYKEAGSLPALKRNLIKIDVHTDPLTKGFTNNVYDETKYASVYTLKRGINSISERAKWSYIASRILYTLSETTDMLGNKKYDNFKDLANDDLAVFLGAIIFRNIEITGNNGVNTSLLNNIQDTIIEHCDILMPFSSIFNHSCDGSVTPAIFRDVNVFFSMDSIKKGQRILANYGKDYDYKQAVTADRIKNLKERFGFRCKCIPCVNDWNPDTVFRSYHSLSFPPSVQLKLTMVEYEVDRLKGKVKKYCSLINSIHLREMIDWLSNGLIIHNKHYDQLTAESAEWKHLLGLMYSRMKDITY
ncbi:SET and MYND domain-containing protein 4-like isoform X2 [Microplitis mediator]|uniref:SET and MYND domain-containing protein 4-like isoform X2 n=1 Tax=Microplitis mediator TaxID=375433 RepID=UPI0025523A09|nr:SET and MYND domain-containing protein 4-like isoform X2 [Microplitis mediator]